MLRTTAFVALALALGSPASAGAVPIAGRGTWETTLAPRDLDGDSATIEAWYDTVLGLTWLADAGASPVGSWAGAMAWAAALEVGGAADWRLPAIADTGAPGCDFSTAGGTDCGYNVDLATSALAHLYYATLANLAIWDASGNHQPGYGPANTGPFTGVAATKYWSSTDQHPLVGYAWAFDFSNGGQAVDLTSAAIRAWAVHDGDVGVPVPEPSTALLVASGLVAAARRRTSRRGPA